MHNCRERLCDTPHGTCGLCNEEAVDAIDFETGNNAESAVTVNLCQDHFREAEDLGYAFEEKYAEEILGHLYEGQRTLADALVQASKEVA